MANQSTITKVLLIEDNEGDYIITKELLSRRPDLGFELEWISSPERGLAALVENSHDICLVDYQLGAISGIDIIRDARERGSETPIIVLTGEHSRSVDAEAMAAGAYDYLVKRQLPGGMLTRSIRYALEQHKIETRLRKLARTDDLTGLANRAEFTGALDFALKRSARGGKPFAAMFLDLDGFKKINDTLGHSHGDLLLQEVAGRLTRSVRAADLVARLGGDEFTILALDIERPSDCATIAQKILAILRQPFRIGEHEVMITASIGIALFPEGGKDADTLMRNADAAMYRAKSEGRGDYHFHSMEQSKAAQQRSYFEKELGAAVASLALDVVYQPQVNLHTGDIVGFEALSRWSHPVLGDVPADRFIQVAEEIGAIKDLGHFVLNRACTDYLGWETSGQQKPKLAVNVSARQINDSGYAKIVEAILKKTGFDPANLVLELTEAAFTGDLATARTNLTSLHRFGIEWSIDDFGTGFSGLSQLRDLPIDALKIDKSFVANLAGDPKNKAITHAIIGLAERLGLEVIAEGVEDEEQVTELCAFGCHFGQGFHYFRPLPCHEIQQLLSPGPALAKERA